MIRYFKLYLRFLKQSLSAELQYRTNFLFLIINNFGWGSVYLFLYVFIFGHIVQVGEWNFQRGLVLGATFLIVQSLNQFLFVNNLKKFPQLIYDGQLDLVLTKPVSSQFYVSLRQFSLRPLLRIILAFLVLFKLLIGDEIKVSLFHFLLYLLMLIFSTLLVYSFWFISCCSIFWLGNIENIYEFFHPVLRTTALPYDILPPLLAKFFFFVIPLSFISTIPTKTLFGLVSWQTIIWGIFITIFFFLLSRKIWNLGLKSYQSCM